jgi:hypothetical protein
MPNGYTADIYDGKDVSLKDYAAQCARAFGAFVHQRDDGHDAALRYPEKRTYAAESLKKAEIELNRWNVLTEAEKYAQWERYVQEKTESHAKTVMAHAVLRKRYTEMLNKVRAVEVPEELAKFKEFLEKNLTDSMEFHCPTDSKFTDDYHRPQDYYVWLDDHEKHLRREVEYYREEADKEVKRYEGAVAYIDLMAETFDFYVKDAQ